MNIYILCVILKASSYHNNSWMYSSIKKGRTIKVNFINSSWTDRSSIIGIFYEHVVSIFSHGVWIIWADFSFSFFFFFFFFLEIQRKHTQIRICGAYSHYRFLFRSSDVIGKRRCALSACTYSKRFSISFADMVSRKSDSISRIPLTWKKDEIRTSDGKSYRAYYRKRKISRNNSFSLSLCCRITTATRT